MSQLFIPELPCLCGSFRRTARALTQMYEEALRPSGLRATQLTILQVLARAGEVSQGQLGEMLAMDSTSLTRTLAIMRRAGWVAEQRGEDRRERRIRLSRAGKSKLRRALPVWKKVQSRLRGKLGKREWESLLQLTHHVTEIAKTQGGLPWLSMERSQQGYSRFGLSRFSRVRLCTYSRTCRTVSDSVLL